MKMSVKCLSVNVLQEPWCTHPFPLFPDRPVSGGAWTAVQSVAWSSSMTSLRQRGRCPGPRAGPWSWVPRPEHKEPCLHQSAVWVLWSFCCRCRKRGRGVNELLLIGIMLDAWQKKHLIQHWLSWTRLGWLVESLWNTFFGPVDGSRVHGFIFSPLRDFMMYGTEETNKYVKFRLIWAAFLDIRLLLQFLLNGWLLNLMPCL